jgi:dTMP kinase
VDGTSAARGRFITIEGPDGAGKSLMAARLAAGLRELGHDAILSREPGGTRLGEAIREILLTRDGPPIHPRADALLFNAARAQHVDEVIRPGLDAGRSVVVARYFDSTLAYQGYGRGVPLDDLRAVIAVAIAGLVPDVTILLDISPETGLRRKQPDETTRFEAAYDLAFHRRVRDGFLELAAAEPRRFRVVDAERPADVVFADVLAHALEALGAGER